MVEEPTHDEPNRPQRVPTSVVEAVLARYKPHCRYLREATMESGAVRKDHRLVPGAVTGSFEIPGSCYIDDTGHFNSVEFNLCYAQLLGIAMAIGAIDSPVRFTELQSTFRKAMESRDFSGRLEVTRIGTGPTGLRVETEVRFWSDAGGESTGTAVAVTVEPVAR